MPSARFIEQLENRKLLSAVPYDTTFGSGGLVGYGGYFKILADNKILVDTNGVIRRLNVNGSVDTTFNAHGVVDDWKPTAARQSDGKLLLLSGRTLSRYNANGSLDTTFGVGGHFSAWVGNATYSAFNPSVMTLQGSNIIVAGDATPAPPSSSNVDSNPAIHDFAVERVTSAGKLDTAFGLHSEAGNTSDSAVSNDVVIGPNGDIYVAGSLPTDPDAFIVRYNPDGSNPVKRQVLGDTYANGLAFQANGQLLIAGEEYDNNTNLDHAFVLRMNPDFTIDSTFGGPDGVLIDSGSNRNAAVAVNVGPDGKIVVSLVNGNVSKLARLLPSGKQVGDSITGYVFHDYNGDGLFDEQDQPLSGWQVYVDKGNTGVYQSGDPVATTDGNGYYHIDGLTSGTYIVREVRQNGWVRTSPAGAWPTHGFYSVTFNSSSGVVSGRDFGNAVPTSFHGQVFNDPAGNGVLFGNKTLTPLSGWTAYVDLNHDGKPDAGDPTSITDSSGNFAFGNLTPGVYTVRLEIKSGWRQTFPVGNGAMYAEQGSYLFYTVSTKPATLASIGGTVFFNINRNGKLDAGEGSLGGVDVYINTPSGQVFASEENGAYSFSGLAPGTYLVHVKVPAGFTQTFPAGNQPHTVIVAKGQAVGNQDFFIG